MFIRVKTEEELYIFNEILETNWLGEGYEKEVATMDEELYLFKKEGDDKFTGTLKLAPFTEELGWNKYFKKESIQQMVVKKVYVIDGLSVLKVARRGKLLGEILSFCYRYAMQHSIDYIVALANPLLVKSLKYHYQIEMFEEEKDWYKGADVFPIYIERESFKKLGTQEWVKKIEIAN